MKSRTLTCITAMTLFTVLALPVQLAAQHTRFKLVDVGTLGGPASYFSAGDVGERVLNNRGMLAGSADVSTVPDPACLNGGDCFITHAFRWQNGFLADLPPLAGGSSSLASAINARGWVSGTSTNGEFDPLIPPSGGFVNRAVLWKGDQIIDLGTLGTGRESQAFYVNDGGQVVGQSSINTIPDPFSFWGAAIHPFIWQNGVMRDLGTLGGSVAGPTENCSVERNNLVTGLSLVKSGATHPFLWDNGNMIDLGTLGGTMFDDRQCVNNRGQVAGASTLRGDNVIHPFLWENGVMSDLGTLGGDNGRVRWINNAGEIVGNADLPGSQNHHAFLWRNGKMIDLGTLGSSSTAHAINSHSQVVGRSKPGPIDSSLQHAFLWEKGGPMIDLNTVIPSNSTLELFEALNINDRGEIMGLGFPPGCDDLGTCGHVFLLIPCDNAASCESKVDVTTAASQNTGAFINKNSTPSTQGRLMHSQMLGAWRALAQRYHILGLGASPRD
jgi:probable HAF family extracellular repeat protein